MSQSPQPTSLKKTKKRLKVTRVSAQLRAELSEYASLLRAIRMSVASDLTGELISASKRQREEEEEESIAHLVRKQPRLSTVLDGTSDRAQDSEDSETDADASDTSKKCKSINSQKPKNIDISTYWPLFPEHCPTPEFDFEEEITAVADVWFRDSNRSSQIQDAKINTIRNDEEGTFEINDTAEHTCAVNDEPITFSNLIIRPLLLSTNTFLNTLLSNLAHHRTRLCHVEKGKMAPMQWVDVLEIVGSMNDPGLDFETLDQIQNRLCEIYGPDECIALKSVQVISKSKQALQEMDYKFQSTLFDSLSIPISQRTQKRMQPIKRVEGEKEAENKKSGEGDNGDDNDKKEDKSDESRPTSSTPIAAERPNVHTDASTSDSEDDTSQPPSDLSSDSSSESD